MHCVSLAAGGYVWAHVFESRAAFVSTSCHVWTCMYVCCTAIGGWDGSGTAVVGASFAIAGRSARTSFHACAPRGVQGDSGPRLGSSEVGLVVM